MVRQGLECASPLALCGVGAVRSRIRCGRGLVQDGRDSIKCRNKCWIKCGDARLRQALPSRHLRSDSIAFLLASGVAGVRLAPVFRSRS